jgi:membrane protein
MAGLRERVGNRVDVLREERPFVDHVIRTFAYYSERNGNAQAGAVTFYAFVSFFPLLALAFFVVGYVSAVFPDARRETIDAIDAVLPGLVGNGEGQIPIETIEEYAGRIGLLALLGLLYSGLGWISAMRRALATMFRVPETDALPFVRGKLRDLVALVVLGVVLVASVSLSGAMSWWSETILHALGLDRIPVTEVLLWLLTHVLAIGATTLLLLAVYELVPHTHVARRALWQGALTGALGFEVLKSLAGFLFTLTMQRPAFQAFGVALILVVWINYFSRLVMLSASWAYNAPIAERIRALEREPLVPDEDSELVEPAPAAVVAEGETDPPQAPAPSGGGDPGRGRRRGVVAALTWVRHRRAR